MRGRREEERQRTGEGESWRNVKEEREEKGREEEGDEGEERRRGKGGGGVEKRGG